jgi:hypothetical protein
MKRLNSVQSRADATIWQHCVEVWLNVRDCWPQFVHDIKDAGVILFCAVVSIAFLLLFPITFPIAGFVSRRNARREVGKYEKIIAANLRRDRIWQDLCPECGGELDTGWECNDCGFDAMQEAKLIRGF